MRVYAIGDIHGHLDKLRHVHDLIAADGGRDARIVHLGDLIDRGPESRGVIEFLMQGQADRRGWIVLKGNHDRQLPRFLEDPRWIDPMTAQKLPWTERDNSGAEATLASYGVPGALSRDLDEVHAEAVANVPHDHARWIDGLPAWHLTPLALFVHGGIRPGVDLCAQTEDDMLWLRRPFLDDTRDHGVLVVHGHSPVQRIEHKPNRLDIDTNAGGGGPLSVVRIDDDGVWILTGDGPVKSEPAP